MSTRNQYKLENGYLLGDFSTSLPVSQLPTTSQVIWNILFYLNIHNDITKAVKLVRGELVPIWKQASVPTINEKSIDNKLRKLNAEFDNIKKEHRHRPDSNKVKEFKKENMELFDIACQRERTKSELYCRCSICKVGLDVQFLCDQRTDRRLFISSSIDIKTSKRVAKHLENISQYEAKKQRLDERVAALEEEKLESPFVSNLQLNSTIGSSSDSECDSNDSCDFNLNGNETSQNRIDLTRVGRVYLRNIGRQISYNIVAQIVTATLIAVNIVTNEDDSNVTVKSKIVRAVERCIRDEEERLRTQNENNPIKSLYIDGKKDDTITRQYSEDGKSFSHLKKKEEHVALLAEPDHRRVGVFTMSKSIAGRYEGERFVSLLKEWERNYKANLSELVAMGCDGANTNTGKNQGIVAHVERYLERPLHHFVCLLHLAELCLKNLIVAIDGKTTGDKTWKGNIGKTISSEEMFEHEFNEDFTQLSYMNGDQSIQFKSLQLLKGQQSDRADQDLLFDLVQLITNGMTDDLLYLKTKTSPYGHHARWLAKAIRLCMLYVRDHSFLNEQEKIDLKTLVLFIINVYMPMFFLIKQEPLATSGPRHFFNFCRRSRFLSEFSKPGQKAVDNTLRRNSYFAHFENICLTMLTDERPSIRERAIQHIKKLRKTQLTEVRTFRVPDDKLNLEAKDYTEMLLGILNLKDEPQVEFFEPPATRNLSPDQLDNLVNHPFECPDFLCHNQYVESTIKDVSSASIHTNNKNLLAAVSVMQIERAKMPNCDTKKDYVIS